MKLTKNEIGKIFNNMFCGKDEDGNIVNVPAICGIEAFRYLVGGAGERYLAKILSVPPIVIQPDTPIRYLLAGKYQNIRLTVFFNKEYIIDLGEIDIPEGTSLKELFHYAKSNAIDGIDKSESRTDSEMEEKKEAVPQKTKVFWSGANYYIAKTPDSILIEDENGNGIDENSKEGKAIVKQYLRAKISV